MDWGAASIRAAVVPQDLVGIARAYLASARHHRELSPRRYRLPDQAEVEAWVRRVVEHPDEQLFVAVVEGEVLGYTHVAVRRSAWPGMLPDERSATVELAVAEDHRRRGVGTLLLRAAERQAREMNATRVVVDMLAANAPALGLYRRNGYDAFGLVLDKQL